jgi:hypothetical protein
VCVITSPTALAAAFPLDVPVGWSNPSDVNMVHALLVLVGIPVLLFIGITVAVYLPSLVRGERIAPGQPPVSDQWLGGPRTSVFVGHAEGEPRAFAVSLHRALAAPARSILVMVDPDARALEVVTGSEVRRTLRDPQVELAVAAMQSLFAAGDLVGGLRRGIQMLAEHARAPLTLHAQQL